MQDSITINILLNGFLIRDDYSSAIFAKDIKELQEVLSDFVSVKQAKITPNELFQKYYAIH